MFYEKLNQASCTMYYKCYFYIKLIQWGKRDIAVYTLTPVVFHQWQSVQSKKVVDNDIIY